MLQSSGDEAYGARLTCCEWNQLLNFYFCFDSLSLKPVRCGSDGAGWFMQIRSGCGGRGSVSVSENSAEMFDQTHCLFPVRFYKSMISFYPMF